MASFEHFFNTVPPADKSFQHLIALHRRLSREQKIHGQQTCIKQARNQNGLPQTNKEIIFLKDHWSFLSTATAGFSYINYRLGSGFSLVIFIFYIVGPICFLAQHPSIFQCNSLLSRGMSVKSFAVPISLNTVHFSFSGRLWMEAISVFSLVSIRCIK